MTTLRNRATPRQAVVMRMIEGAVRNAAHAHPGWITDPRAAASIAKRATGTLTSQWGSVLAAPRASSERRGGHARTVLPGSAYVTGATEAGSYPSAAGRRGVRVCRHTPLVQLHRRLGRMAGEAKRFGEVERYAALVDALRAVAEVMA